MIKLSNGIEEKLRIATYDGDTCKEERAWARSQANVIITNPGIFFFQSFFWTKSMLMADERYAACLHVA